MKITREEFEFKHHSFEKAGIKFHEKYDYVYHDVHVWNKITIDDVNLNAYYQTGLYYDYDNYDCPINDLYLSDFGTSRELLIIDKLSDEDVWNNTEDAQEVLDELKEMGSNIDTLDKLKQVHEFLHYDNNPGSTLNFLDECHSFDVNDYIVDDYGILTLKK